MEKGRSVHPDCINASNPYHECVEYCFQRIAESKSRAEEDETNDSSKEPEERIVHPDCINASNPYHECSDHCFKRIADLKAQIERNESGWCRSGISMGKTYVIFVGRNPGVYDSWKETHTQVNKYSNALHRSYLSKDKAFRAFNSYKEKQHGFFAATAQKCSSSTLSSTSTVSSSSGEKMKQTEELAKLIKRQLDLADEYRRNATKIAEMCEEIKKKIISVHISDLSVDFFI